MIWRLGNREMGCKSLNLDYSKKQNRPAGFQKATGDAIGALWELPELEKTLTWVEVKVEGQELKPEK